MRILHLVHTPRHSGAETLVRDLCVAHAQTGITSAVASMCPLDPAFSEDNNTIIQSGSAVFYPNHNLQKWDRISHFAKVIRSFRPDVIFGHSVIPSFYGRLALPLSGHRPKFVSVLHNANNDDFADTYLRVVEKLLKWRNDHVVAVSAAGKASYEQRIGRIRPVSVITNGINIDRFRHLDRDQSRKVLNISDSSKIFLQVGRLSDIKQQKWSLECLAPLLREGEAQLWLAGILEDVAYIDKLKATAVSLGVSDKVHILGSRSDVPALLAACDVYLMPSKTEAQGIALLEALACGVPCLISNIDVFDFARQSPGVCAVDLGDNAGFLSAARQLLTMPHHSHDLAPFSIAKTAKNYADLAFSLSQK